MRIAILASVLVAGAVSVQAAEVRNASGVGKGKTETIAEAVGEGHMFLNSVSTYESFVAADPDSPFNGMTGKCWGAIEVRAPGASGQGNCVFKDAAGDKNYNVWIATGLAKDGALVGTWTLLGGTGKFEGASGGGNFHSKTDRKAGTFENTVEGALVLK